jgi:tetratricopeptide (TPR) repeat protein
LCEVESGRIVANLGQPEFAEVTWLSFSPDGARMAVATGSPAVWDLHELRAGLIELGLDASGLPERSEPLYHRDARFEVERGPQLAPPIQWSQNWMRLAWDEGRRGNYTVAISDATSAIRSLPWGATPTDQARILLVRGEYQLANHNPWAARTDWQQALALAPDLPDLPEHLARLHLLGIPEVRDPRRALNLLASQAQSDDLPLHEPALIGIAHVELNQPEKGLSLFDKLTTEKPRPLLCYFRAAAMHKLGRRQEAKELFDQAKAVHDDSRQLLTTLEREELDRLRGEVESLLAKD